MPLPQENNIRFIAGNLRKRIMVLRETAQLTHENWESLTTCIRLTHDLEQELDNAPSEAH